MSKEHILKEFIRTKLSEAGMSSKFKKAVEEYKEVSLKLQDLFADRAKALEGYKKAEGSEKEKYKAELSRIQKLVNPLQDQMEKAERVFNKALLSEPEELEEGNDDGLERVASGLPQTEEELEEGLNPTSGEWVLFKTMGSFSKPSVKKKFVSVQKSHRSAQIAMKKALDKMDRSGEDGGYGIMSKDKWDKEDSRFKVESVNESASSVIKNGDKVTIRTPQKQLVSGKAVMKSPHGGWTLNMGGKYGRPGSADDKNIVKVTRGGKVIFTESVNESKKYDTLDDFEKVAKIGDIFYLGSEDQFKRAPKNDYYKVVGKKSDNSLLVTKGNSNKKYVIGADRYGEPIIVVNEGKHDKEIKALEDKIKAVKGKTPADLGKKAVMGDDLARLKAMNEGYSYANATKLELQQYLINLNIELSGEKNPKWIKYIKGDIEDVKKELQKRSNSKKESVNEASRRANEMFGETKFGQEIHKMLKGKWDAKKVEDYLDGLGGGSTQKNLRIIDFISKDAGLNPRLYDTQTLGKQISDLVDKLEVLYKDFTKGTDVKKFDDVHIKSKNLTGIVYAISGNTLVVKTASGMVKTTKDDVEAVMSDGVIKEDSVNESDNTPMMSKSGKDISVDTTFVQLSNKFGTLKHIGMGDFVVKTKDGDVEFRRVNKQIDGFSGRTHMLSGDSNAIASLIKNMKPKVVKESVTEITSVSQVRSTIEKVKKQLIQKWKQKGGYENFGEKEGRMLGDKFNANPYGSSDERRIHSMIQDFENWAMNYDGRNESVTEVELPAATIPASIKSKLVMAIDKIKDTKLSYNQKLNVVGSVMDSLGIDKSEFGKMASKLKGTMESSIKEGSPCWDGYQQIGMKEKGGKQVPNCVPEGKVNEGNAFGMAVTQAKKEGKKEFEFNGKTYKVKKGKGKVNESDCGCGSKAVVSEAVNVRKLLQRNVARELKVSPSSIEVGVGNYGSRTANDGSQVVVIGLNANVKKISIPQADYFDTTVDYGGYLIVKADGKTGKLLKVLDRVKSQNDIRMADYIKEVNEAVKEPEVITKLRGILKNHQHASIKDPKLGKSVKVDAFSASAIVQVYDAINDANKAKFAAMSIHQMATVAYKLMKK